MRGEEGAWGGGRWKESMCNDVGNIPDVLEGQLDQYHQQDQLGPNNGGERWHVIHEVAGLGYGKHLGRGRYNTLRICIQQNHGQQCLIYLLWHCDHMTQHMTSTTSTWHRT